ncbi:MAG TPA: magnesium/cobalt transporter CorA [Gaiellales bacterium]|nr:magnesium/cobalt transporter CorA [Gaiellales bacterium]
MAVTTCVYRDGARSDEQLPFERVSDVLREKDVLVWVDVDGPTLEETAQLGEEFSLHPFALEDAMTPHQRPKIERYEGYVFVVAYAALPQPRRAPVMDEVSMFVAHNYIVTIRHGGGTMLDAVRERIDRTPSLARGGGSQIAYAVLDEIIDGYFPVVEGFEDRIERAEDDLIGDGSGDTSGSLAEAFQIKRDLLTFRRVVAPLRDVLGRVVHIDQAVLGVDLDTEFRDLYDHVLRVYDELDTQRDLVTSILEAHLSVVSNRLNLVVLKLSSWAGIVLVPTLIAGIYGMNFDHMPELHWRLGYVYALALMGGSALVLWVRFKRAGWL